MGLAVASMGLLGPGARSLFTGAGRGCFPFLGVVRLLCHGGDELCSNV